MDEEIIYPEEIETDELFPEEDVDEVIEDDFTEEAI